MKRTLMAAVFAALVLSPLAASAQRDTRDAYQEALAEYETGHYRDAVSWLSIAGENGDVRAQQLLGMMYLYGEELYGSAVPRDLGLARSWLYRAEAQGDNVARFTLSRLDRGRPIPSTLALMPGEASGE
jgi:TPR repeat protein